VFSWFGHPEVVSCPSLQLSGARPLVDYGLT
jgi:hypothetical protein